VEIIAQLREVVPLVLRGTVGLANKDWGNITASIYPNSDFIFFGLFEYFIEFI
jgi:hypothetical protein